MEETQDFIDYKMKNSENLINKFLEKNIERYEEFCEEKYIEGWLKK